MKNNPTLYETVYNAGFTLLGICVRFLPSCMGLRGKRLVLCYHSVANDGGRFSTPPSVFTRQMQWLKTHGTIVSLEELLSGKPGTHAAAAITFDDGYRDTLRTAAPILARLGIPATVFAIGKPWRVNRKALGVRKKLLTIKELQILRRMGWEIGFHTTTHSRLDEVGKRSLEAEIIEGKKEFRRALGGRVRYFAYPHGAASSEVRDVVRQAGFQYALTTSGWFTDARNPLEVSRICIEGALTDRQFRTLLTFPGILFHAAMTTVVRWKEKAMRVRIVLPRVYIRTTMKRMPEMAR